VADKWEQYAVQLGQRIKDLRRAKGVSQGTACRRVGMSIDTWSRLERGEGQEPKLSTLMRVAEALEVELADLFPGNPESTSTPRQQELVSQVTHLPEEAQEALLLLLRRR